jgi:nucleotide-binding universal stress UspA family protein
MARIKEKTKMRKLLVLTDFTANAAHAAKAAVQFSSKLHADLLLYHSVQSLPIVPDYSGGPYVTEAANILFNDCKEQLNKEAEPLRSLPIKTDGYHPKISCINGEGTLGDNIKELSGQQGIQMVIMGGRSGGLLDHLLTGSETAKVIREAKKPVLIIPAKANLDIIEKIVFATDFSAADISAVRYLLEIAHLLGVHLEIVHVAPAGEVVTDVLPEIAFREYLNQLDNNRVSYQQLNGDHISQLLQEHCHVTGADVLAMTRGHHDFISRVFGHSETRQAIAQDKLAVLIFPPDFEEN